MPTSQTIRDALRVLYTSAPEAAATVEKHIDDLEARERILSNEDAFKAFVLEQAQMSGQTLALMQRLDDSVCGNLAEAEFARQQRLLIDAQDRRDRGVTIRSVLSQPVVMGLVGILSTVLAGVGTLVMHLLRAGG